MNSTTRWFASVLSLGLGGFIAAPLRAETIRLATLQADETIVATVQSWGCFKYHTRYELRFRRDRENPSRVFVRVNRLRGVLHRNIGSRVVEAAELRGLDAGVDAYRKHESVCVSSGLNEIRLRLVRDGEVVAEEMHRGHSCDVAALSGALDLSDLPGEFDGDRPKGQADGYVRPNNRLKPSAGGGLAAE